MPKKRALEPIFQDFGSAMAPPSNQCCRVDAPGFRLAGLIACAGYLQECFVKTAFSLLFLRAGPDKTPSCLLLLSLHSPCTGYRAIVARDIVDFPAFHVKLRAYLGDRQDVGRPAR